MKQTLILTAFFIICVTSLARAESFTASQAYKECSGFATTNPQTALVKAEEWLKIEDSLGAHHCKSMALYGLKRYEESATSLSLVRDRLDPKDIMLRTYVARQASRAWILASRAETALNTLSAQIEVMNQEGVDNATEARLTAELLLDRAKIRQQYGQHAEAVQDLDHAVSLRPSNDDVLLARAEAFIALKDEALAKEDLQVILRVNPTHEKAVRLMRSLRDVTTTSQPELPASLPKH